MLKRSGSLALGTILVSLAAGSAYAACVTREGETVRPKCTCGTSAPTFLSFTTSLGSGNCGSVVNSSGGPLLALGCNNLFVGAGISNVPPNTVPDSVNTKMKVSCCRGKSLTLAAASSTDTGSNLNCTDTNCLYGPPLPVVSATSTCNVLKVAQPAVGSARCDTGAVTQSLPVTSAVYLTIDVLPKRPGTQACPVCLAGACLGDGDHDGIDCTMNSDCGTGICATGTCQGGSNPGVACNMDSDCGTGTCATGNTSCHGGPNNGLACTPGSQLVTGPQWPTSQNCPPPSGRFIGVIPVPQQFTTGTATKTAVDLSQNRVFCGFCRDTASGCFEGDPMAAAHMCPTPAGAVTPCTSDAGCTLSPYTSCQQRDSGAFGQGAARTVTENGAPAGAISTGGPAASATLASVFCIPPTFNGIIDGSADLPGPGAVALQGQAQLLP